MAKPCNQGCLLMCMFLCVFVCAGGSTWGSCSLPSPTPASTCHPDGHDWLGEEGVEVLLAATWEKVLIYSVFGLKLVNIAIKNFKSVFWGGGEPSALSICRGLLCSIFQCFVVTILILDHNPFAPAYLSEFRWTFILWSIEEVVGVLKTTGEGKVSLVALISIMTHFFFVERQHFRHIQMRLYHQGAQSEMYSASPSLCAVVFNKQKGEKQCNLLTRSSPFFFCLPPKTRVCLRRYATEITVNQNVFSFPAPRGASAT